MPSDPLPTLGSGVQPLQNLSYIYPAQVVASECKTIRFQSRRIEYRIVILPPTGSGAPLARVMPGDYQERWDHRRYGNGIFPAMIIDLTYYITCSIT